MAVSRHRTITDDLLTTAVRIKREAGVSHADIQIVVDRYASEEQWNQRTGGIGFPLVEDIPQDNRGAFLAALAELAAQPGRSERGSSRVLTANDIWPSRVL